MNEKTEKLTVPALFRGASNSKVSAQDVFKALVILILFCAGLFQLTLAVQSLKLPDVYRKDFMQEYLLARAVIERVNPYLPVSTLAAKLVDQLPVHVFPHPTPHPPPVAILTLPLGLTNYVTAARIWFGFELLCLAGSAWTLLMSIHRAPSWGSLAILTIASVAWAPVLVGLIVGQLMTLLLLLLSFCWWALREKRDAAAGVFLGLVLALKLMGIPLLIFLAIRRRWGTVFASLLTAALANVVAAFLMGFGHVIEYYLTVSRALFPIYRAEIYNLSAWSVGWRLFDGTGSPDLLSIQAPPLIHAPRLAPIVSALLPLALLVVGIALALRARDMDTSFGILVCVTILFSPVAWTHYLVLMAIPLMIALLKLSDGNFPAWAYFKLLGVIVTLGLPSVQLSGLQEAFASSQAPTEPVVVPAIVGLFGLIYSVGIVVMLWFLWRIDSQVTIAAGP